MSHRSAHPLLSSLRAARTRHCSCLATIEWYERSRAADVFWRARASDGAAAPEWRWLYRFRSPYRDETGVVLATNPLEPLHPRIALIAPDLGRLPGDVDLAVRDSSGGYARHIVETLRPPDALDLSLFV